MRRWKRTISPQGRAALKRDPVETRYAIDAVTFSPHQNESHECCL
jgi:hypothetical protein